MNGTCRNHINFFLLHHLAYSRRQSSYVMSEPCFQGLAPPTRRSDSLFLVFFDAKPFKISFFLARVSRKTRNKKHSRQTFYKLNFRLRILIMQICLSVEGREGEKRKASKQIASSINERLVQMTFVASGHTAQNVSLISFAFANRSITEVFGCTRWLHEMGDKLRQFAFLDNNVALLDSIEGN